MILHILLVIFWLGVGIPSAIWYLRRYADLRGAELLLAIGLGLLGPFVWIVFGIVELFNNDKIIFKRRP